LQVNTESQPRTRTAWVLPKFQHCARHHNGMASLWWLDNLGVTGLKTCVYGCQLKGNHAIGCPLLPWELETKNGKGKTKRDKEKVKRDEKRRKETKRDEKRRKEQTGAQVPCLPNLGFQANLDALATPSSFRQAPHCLPQKRIVFSSGQNQCIYHAFSFLFRNTDVQHEYRMHDLYNYLTHLAQQRPHLRVSRSLRYSSPSGNWWQGSRQIRQHTVAMINWCQQKNLLALSSRHCSSPSEQSKGSQARPVAPQQKCFFSSVLPHRNLPWIHVFFASVTFAIFAYLPLTMHEKGQL
jgi:hypothetical protein